MSESEFMFLAYILVIFGISLAFGAGYLLGEHFARKAHRVDEGEEMLRQSDFRK